MRSMSSAAVLRWSASSNGRMPCEQRVHRGAELIDVGARIAARRVGEGLRRRPRNRQPGRLRRGVRRRGDAEVRECRSVVFRDENVGRLDVAVQNPRPVRGLDSRRDLDADAQRLGDREGLAAVAHLKVRPRAELHHQVRSTVSGDTGLVDRDDGGVRRQHRHDIRLGGELLGRTARHPFRDQHLHRDPAFGQLLLVEVDVGETAGSERFDEREAREVRGRHRRALRIHSRSSMATVMPSPRSSTSPGTTTVASLGCSRTGSDPERSRSVPLVVFRSVAMMLSPSTRSST